MNKYRSIIFYCLLLSVPTWGTSLQQPTATKDTIAVQNKLEKISQQVKKSFHQLTKKAYIGYLGLRSADLLKNQQLLGNADTMFDNLNYLLQNEIEPLIKQGEKLSVLHFQRTGERSYLDQFEFYQHRIQGLILSNAEEFLEARRTLLRASMHAEKLSNLIEKAYVLNNLSYCSFQVGKSEEATTELKEAVQIAEKTNSLSALGLFLYNLGWVYLNTQQTELAIPCFERSAEISQSLKLPIHELAALNNLGSIHLSRKEWKEAGTYFSRNLEIARKLNSLRFRAMSAFNFAVILAQKKQYQKAANLLDEALNVYESDGSIAFMNAEKRILKQKALLLLQFVNTQTRQQITSPYLESKIESQETILEGHIHSHFSHLLHAKNESNSNQHKK